MSEVFSVAIGAFILLLMSAVIVLDHRIRSLEDDRIRALERVHLLDVEIARMFEDMRKQWDSS